MKRCNFNFNNIPVNEGIGLNTTSGYTSGSVPDGAGFVYQVMPLSFDLLTPNEGRKIPEEAMHELGTKFFKGDLVKGISPYDNKEHKGIIQRFLIHKGKTLGAYILDYETGKVIPIDLQNAKKVKRK